MAATQWNDAEDAALEYLPHRAQVIYLRGLRRWMDYASGVVGVSRGLSYQQLVELLEVAPEFSQNNRRTSVTVKEVRVSLAQMERVGLIVRMEGRRISSRAETLVFRLPLALVDSSAQKSKGEVRAKSGHRSEGERDTNNGAAFVESKGEVRAKSGHRSEGTHPVSGIRNTKVIDTSSQDSTRARGNECDVVMSRQYWFLFFANECGGMFSPQRVHTAVNGRMFDAWVEQGVTVADVRQAMEIAHGQLNGGPPASPGYYGWAVTEVLRAKHEGDGDGSGKDRHATSGQDGRRVSSAERSRRIAEDYLRGIEDDTADVREIDGEAVVDVGGDVSRYVG